MNRTIAANADTVWHVLINPNQREIWAAPDDDHVLSVEMHAVREGGRDVHRCGPKHAPDYLVETHWYRLAGPVFACFTETLDIGPDRLSTSLITYTLEQEGSDTRLLVHVDIVSYAGAEAIPEHQAGWTSALDRLVRMVKDGRLAAPASV